MCNGGLVTDSNWVRYSSVVIVVVVFSCCCVSCWGPPGGIIDYWCID